MNLLILLVRLEGLRDELDELLTYQDSGAMADELRAALRRVEVAIAVGAHEVREQIDHLEESSRSVVIRNRRLQIKEELVVAQAAGDQQRLADLLREYQELPR